MYRYCETLYYFKKATKFLLSNPNIIKIGITGSNGKTSIKNILYEFLSTKYIVVKTPKNFNTPKGTTYTINKLCNPNTQCIIFEMGAKNVGDIRKLCKMTYTQYGILSNISKQHLETFKTFGNIFKTKNELSNYLGNNLCVYCNNDKFSRLSYELKSGEKLIVGTISKLNVIKNHRKLLITKSNTNYFYRRNFKLDIVAQNIKIKNGCTHFDLKCLNHTYKLKTKLLGEHNICNILQAFALAQKLACNTKALINSIKNLQPVEHRLEYLNSNINILDDSYNCSLNSAKNSLKVLSSFVGTKVCCTPGIIEGGKEQEKINTTLALLLQKYSNIQIIVGKTNRKYFEKVLNKKSAYYVDTLNDAKKYFNLVDKNGCLLLLNDLPDDYD